MRVFKRLIALVMLVACVFMTGVPMIAEASELSVTAISTLCRDGIHVMGKRVYLGRFKKTYHHTIPGDLVCEVVRIYDEYEIWCDCGEIFYYTEEETYLDIHSLYHEE